MTFSIYFIISSLKSVWPCSSVGRASIYSNSRLLHMNFISLQICFVWQDESCHTHQVNLNNALCCCLGYTIYVHVWGQKCYITVLFIIYLLLNRNLFRCLHFDNSSEGEFKTRYNGHTCSFRNSRYKHATELSKYVWHLKESSVKYSIKWRIMKKCKSYSNKTKRCNLCLHEKFLIIYYPKLSSLNSRNELLSKCRHRNKFLLSNK
jgi:hypothetical protein